MNTNELIYQHERALRLLKLIEKNREQKKSIDQKIIIEDAKPYTQNYLFYSRDSLLEEIEKCVKLELDYIKDYELCRAYININTIEK